MLRNIMWEKIGEKPQMFLVEIDQLYPNDELFDSFVDEILNQFLSNSITDNRKDELYDQLIEYLKKVAKRERENDFSDLIKIMHSNIKIFSTINLGMKAGLKGFKNEIIQDTIVPLFANFFDPIFDCKKDWCIYMNDHFYFDIMLKCLLFANRNNEFLDELAKLIVILSMYLDLDNLKILYLSLTENDYWRKIVDDGGIKTKYVLSCLGAHACGDDKCCDFVDSCLNSITEILKVEEYDIIYDVLQFVTLLGSALENEAKYFFINGRILNGFLEKSPLMDYSVVSTQYYKVIEVELKKRFIHTALENLDYKIIKANTPINASNEGAITLGNIYHVFDWLTANWDNNFVQKDVEHFKNRLKNLFNNEINFVKEMKVIINQENLYKYRNPPAHTKTLEYSLSREAYKVIIFFVLLIDMIQSNFQYKSIINTVNTPFLFRSN